MANQKRCSKCKKEKDEGEFCRDTSSKDGLHRWCKLCKNSHKTEWAADNQQHVFDYQRQWNDDNRKHVNAYQRKLNAAAREAVLNHYGRVCICCNSTKRLTIDHINGNGGEHRRELFGSEKNASSGAFYRWLIKNNFPDGFQTMCQPCNASKRNGERCRLIHQSAASSPASPMSPAPPLPPGILLMS